ncbi:MAG TPA: methyltransferase domain-containing protein [Bryobacteraceae bacterium]|nr:methyltransferase domain-containing protein [Bryobacteraceae bacterium]
MSLLQWNLRYRAGEQLFETPAPLVERFAAELPAGDALDLACGPGRNALYLAQQGWRVTAIDGSPIAIGILRARARDKQLTLDSQIADLERGQFEIQPESFDLICDCYYLQRDLIPRMQAGVRPGGLLIAIVHLAGPDQPEGTPTRTRPGELPSYFTDWTVLHYYEGQPTESCHQHPIAELVARR